MPWQRIIRESALYAAILAVLFLLLMRDQPFGSLITGIAFGMVFYVLLGFVMAKLGIERKTFAQRRAEAAERGDRDATKNEASSGSDAKGVGAPKGPKPKAAPTRRTNAQPAPKKSSRKRR